MTPLISSTKKYKKAIQIDMFSSIFMFLATVVLFEFFSIGSLIFSILVSFLSILRSFRCLSFPGSPTTNIIRSKSTSTIYTKIFGTTGLTSFPSSSSIPTSIDTIVLLSTTMMYSSLMTCSSSKGFSSTVSSWSLKIV